LRQKDGVATGGAPFIDDVALESLIVRETETEVMASEVGELGTATVAEEPNDVSIADEVGVREIKI
jgi:hypothetical protein